MVYIYSFLRYACSNYFRNSKIIDFLCKHLQIYFDMLSVQILDKNSIRSFFAFLRHLRSEIAAISTENIIFRMSSVALQ